MSALDRTNFSDDEMMVVVENSDDIAHKLGAPAEWPLALRNAVTMCMTSQAPMQVWWGRDLMVFYNDAAISSVASHPHALGRAAPDVWADRWSTLWPVVERVLTEAATVRHGELVLAPLLGTDGAVAGIACAGRLASPAESPPLQNLA
jgi:hypothetical protein